MDPIPKHKLQRCDKDKTKSGRTVYIVLDEDNDSVAAYDRDGNPIGEFKFYRQEDDNDEWHLLQSMFLEEQPGFKRDGIGELMLRRFIDGMGTTVIAEEHTGQTNDTGSYLTGDGVGFVQRMREKDLIAPAASDRFDKPDDDEW